MYKHYNTKCTSIFNGGVPVRHSYVAKKKSLRFLKIIYALPIHDYVWLSIALFIRDLTAICCWSYELHVLSRDNSSTANRIFVTFDVEVTLVQISATNFQ